MKNDVETSQLDDLAERLIRLSREAEKEYKKFLRAEGNKLKRRVKSQIRVAGIRRQTGRYERSIKRGKVYEKGR